MTRKGSSRTRRRAPATPDNDPLAEGMALHRAGRLEAAERCYRRLRRRDAGYGEALRLRAVLAHQQRRPEDAIALLRRAAEQQPRNPVVHHTLAEILRAVGRDAEAVPAYRRARALDPQRHATGIDLADTLAAVGESDEALAVYRAVAEAAPGHDDAHERIAMLCHERGEPDAAHAELERWRAAAGGAAATRRRLGAAYAAIGAYAEAAAIHRAQIAAAPEDAAACAALGGVLQSQGEFEESRRWLERALDIEPGLGWVYAALVADRGYRLPAEREAALAAGVEAEDTEPTARMHMRLALGQLHDRRREHAQAFDHFRAGNRLHAAAAPFDPATFSDRVDRIIATCTPTFFAERAHLGDPSERPVFIVGMPRSGTSLVEQIIASHPQAHGAGELDDIRRMVRELPARLGTRRRYPECLADIDAAGAGALAERYLGALDARAPAAARVTDKMPFNMLWLGLIALLFPNARVIYCRRDALDNCLSCYFQIFSRGLRFAYDLTHLGHVYREHERLMAHWRQALPLTLHTVDYETLVAEGEAGIRRLIDCAGLPWDDRCLDFHRSEREVRTASVWQVRQPVYGSSVARWRAYAPWLGTLREALAR